MQRSEIDKLTKTTEWQRTAQEAADKAFAAGKRSTTGLGKHGSMESDQARAAVDHAMNRALKLAESALKAERPTVVFTAKVEEVVSAK